MFEPAFVNIRILVKPKGKKLALVAVGHSLLVIAYHMSTRRTSYQELGGEYFDRRSVEAQRTRLMRKLEAHGVKVIIEAVVVGA